MIVLILLINSVICNIITRVMAGGFTPPPLHPIHRHAYVPKHGMVIKKKYIYMLTIVSIP